VVLFAPHAETITVAGMFYNLLWVSLGNIIAGALFVAAGYGLASGKPSNAIAATPIAVPAE
jgi:nitrite transporter NirC